MALDFCFDRSTFLEQICRACSRYYSYDCKDEEKMEFFHIFDDVKAQPKLQLDTEYIIKYENEDATSVQNCDEIIQPSEAVKEIFEDMLIWNLNIKPSDGLPQQICKDCMERFRSVKSFREECLDTQKVLISYFRDFSLLCDKSPKTESVKSEPHVSPAPSFNADDLVEEVPESPEHGAQSPITSPHLRHSPKFGGPPFYAESSMGTPPPPLFEDIKTEPIDVQTMEIIKTEEELQLAFKAKDEIKEKYDFKELEELAKSTPATLSYNSNDDDSSTTTDDEDTQMFTANNKVNSSSRNHLQCKICCDMFLTRKQLKDHQRCLHPETKPYACNQCSSAFKSSFTLAQHKLKHNRIDSLRCELCGKFFRSQLHLQRHTKNFHLTSTYTCHICHQKFEEYTQIRFQYHVRQHGEKRFHCQYCEKSFHQKIHLVNHERTHTKEQPFRCDICSKSFRQQIACQEHMLTHSDPKPFKCKICEKGFTQRSSLRLHYRLHSGDKPFRCEHCGQQFVQKAQLRMHATAHNDTIAETFAESSKHATTVCQHCSATFSTAAHLEAHIATLHTQKRQQNCLYCSKTFTLETHLKAHMQMHHHHQHSKWTTF